MRLVPGLSRRRGLGGSTGHRGGGAATRALGLLLALSAAGADHTACAQPIYSNLGVADSYSAAATDLGTGLGMVFSAGRTANVGHVDLPLAAAQPGATVSITVSIYASGSLVGFGVPPLWTATGDVSAAGMYTFASDAQTPVALTVNQMYYLTVVPSGGGASWNIVNSGQVGIRLIQQCFDSIGCFWTADSSAPYFDLNAFRVADDSGACCSPRTGACAVLEHADCTALGLSYIGPGQACAPGLCHACPADFNQDGTLSAQDIFDFLSAWFAGCP